MTLFSSKFHFRRKFVVDGIEGFWGFARTRLVRFRGMRPETFNLHLKECEFTFNYRGQDIYQLILKILRERPLN